MAITVICPCSCFEGLSENLITAALRPGKRPTGVENAAIPKRVIQHLRRHWPHTRIVLRGDGHFSNPELMRLVLNDPYADFTFGLKSNAVLARLAQDALAHTQNGIGCVVKRLNAATRHRPTAPRRIMNISTMPLTSSVR